MVFELDASGIKIRLKIKNYRRTNREDWDSEWCACDFHFYSYDWLNYYRQNNEVLLSSEIDEIYDSLTRLLDNQMTQTEEIICIEPDFVFKLYPQKDLSKDPSYTYVRPGYEIQDIYLEWKIYFYEGDLSENYLTLTLYRDDIESLRDYLGLVKNK